MKDDREERNILLSLKNTFSHYGVKGMRWGHRLGKTFIGKHLDKKWEKKVRKRLNSERGFVEIWNRMADKLNNGIIDSINEKYKDVDFNDPKNEKKYTTYLSEFAKAQEKEFPNIINDMFGTNFSRTKKPKVKYNSSTESYDVEFVDVDIQQNENDILKFEVKCIFDERGRIVGFKFVDVQKNLKQSDKKGDVHFMSDTNKGKNNHVISIVSTNNRAEFAHYGVLGMRLGHRMGGRSANDKGVSKGPEARARNEFRSRNANYEVSILRRKIKNLKKENEAKNFDTVAKRFNKAVTEASAADRKQMADISKSSSFAVVKFFKKMNVATSYDNWNQAFARMDRDIDIANDKRNVLTTKTNAKIEANRKIFNAKTERDVRATYRKHMESSKPYFTALLDGATESLRIIYENEVLKLENELKILEESDK